MNETTPTNNESASVATQKIGLFCGTFNPIHMGHLVLAECARDQFGLEKVIFVTSPVPPHRQNESLLNAAARLELVSAAVAGNPSFLSSPVELEREGPSYTVDTAEYFRARYPQSSLFLIIGEDNLPLLKDWHRAIDLVANCKMLVAPRIISDRVQAPQNCHDRGADYGLPGLQWTFIDFPYITVSGTTIRHRLAHGQSVLYMVPPQVNKLIIDRGYYNARP